MGEESGVVEFRYRPSSFWFPRLWVVLLLLFGLLTVVLDPETDAVRIVIYSLIFATQLAIPMLNFINALRHPVAVRLTPDVIEWPASKVCREWGEVVAIRVCSRRGFRRWLPGLILISSRGLDYARRAGTRPAGATIDTSHLVADREEVLAAILRYTDVPVFRD